MKSVTLDPSKIHPNPVHRNVAVMKRLRDEGIPVYGDIALEGVDSGELTITSPDLATGEVTYRWNDQL